MTEDRVVTAARFTLAAAGIAALPHSL